MKKEIFLKTSKRILILLLCSALVSGTCFNKYKLSANATSIAVGYSAFTLYEICMYIGTLIAGGIGIGFVVDNRDQIASMGKDFIDSCNLENLTGWTLAKVNTAGQSYVYGTEALQEVKNTSFEVIQGGGASPENNDDNDGDGDVDFDDRTLDLQKIGMWATATFTNFINEQIQPLLDKVNAGEETFLDDYIDMQFLLNDLTYDGPFLPDNNGMYNGNFYCEHYDGTTRNWFQVSEKVRLCGYYDSNARTIDIVKLSASLDNINNVYGSYKTQYLSNGEWCSAGSGESMRGCFKVGTYSCNFPVFANITDAVNYLNTGLDYGCINKSKVYRIADWLQENWQGSIEALNTGVRSMYDNMLIVGESLNQAMTNQLNGLGFIEDLLARLAAALPLPLPETVDEPKYYPETSPDPKPESLPWEDVVPAPKPTPEPDPNPEPEPTPDPEIEDDILNYAVDLRDIFPFCIPFDFIALLNVLDADPIAPRFEFPFKLESIGMDEIYVIDLSVFDEQMENIRKLEIVGFIIGLMVLTGKVIKW